jgi:opacity protein-like surface antigen
MKHLIILLLTLIHQSTIFAQNHKNRVSILPTLGMDMPFCYVKSGNNYATFRTNSLFYPNSPGFLSFSTTVGISIDYQRNQQWGVNFGIRHSVYGFSFHVSADRADSLQNQVPLISQHESLYIGGTLNRVFLNFYKPFSMKHLWKKKEKQTGEYKIEEISHYRLNFQLQPFLGGSYNYAGALNRESLNGVSSFQGQQIIEYSHKEIEIRYWNFSVNAGLRIQFFSWNKKKNNYQYSAQLNIYYNQGIRRIATQQVEYSINRSKPYQTFLGMRGTVLGATLSFPIQIAKW